MLTQPISTLFHSIFEKKFAYAPLDYSNFNLYNY